MMVLGAFALAALAAMKGSRGRQPSSADLQFLSLPGRAVRPCNPILQVLSFCLFKGGFSESVQAL